ncbi:MAG: DUF1338 family protein [bacterium]
MSNYFSSMLPNDTEQHDQLSRLLCGLLERYFLRVPDADAIFSCIRERGDEVLNDHMAFRSIDIRSLLKVFLPYGYQVCFQENGQFFNFQSKHLTAVWLKHPHPAYPYIFISECRINEIPGAAALLQPFLDHFNDPIDDIQAMDSVALIDYLHQPRWPLPDYRTYQALASLSEYLSWVLYNQYYLNHFTLQVHSLNSFSFPASIQTILNSNQSFSQTCSALSELYIRHITTFNRFLIDQGFTLAQPKGHQFQRSNDGLLLQSSTKSALIDAEFKDGVFPIPGSYVEFAYRGLRPASVKALLRGDLSFSALEKQHYRDGFEQDNADKIFESTYVGAEDLEDQGTAFHVSTDCRTDVEARIREFLTYF